MVNDVKFLKLPFKLKLQETKIKGKFFENVETIFFSVYTV